MGFFDVPTVERKPWGILGLILNILPLPGLGTIITGAKEGQHTVRYVIVGILQIVIPILGWIWAIVWGIRIFLNSTVSFTETPTAAAAAEPEPAPAPAPVAKAPAKKAATKKAAPKKAAKKAAKK